MHGIACADALAQLLYFASIDEQPNVLADAVLFVDHAETHANEPLFQILKHFRNGFAFRYDIGGILRIGAQRACNFDGAGHVATD